MCSALLLDSPVSLQTGLAGENLHILGIDGGGSMIVDFFAADGTNIDTLNIPLPSGNRVQLVLVNVREINSFREILSLTPHSG